MDWITRWSHVILLVHLASWNCLGQDILNINDKSTILYMMERPTESLFLPKGEKSEVRIVVPQKYVPEEYQGIAEDLENRFGADGAAIPIQIQDINLPDLSLPKLLPRNEPFSILIPFHKDMASRLIEVFMGMRSVNDLTSACGQTRDSVNPGLWTYALQVALTHRNDTQDIDVPPQTAMWPDQFLDGGIFRRARQDAKLLKPEQREPIEIPQDYTATNVDVEHRVAYFREDMGVNLHHWSWHLVYPTSGTEDIVKKDRRGELFYYQHQQILGRYDFERLANNLGLVKPIGNFYDPIEEGYFPKLDNIIASRVFPSRTANSKIRDVNRAEQFLNFQIQDLERWRDRIYQAIHERRALTKDFEYVSLTGTDGIDILANMLESSDLNINPDLYGNLHNMGHIAVASCHDPDNRHLELFGVMGNLATAMRDPIFYRWHKFVDNILQAHKATLKPYTVKELGYDGVVMRDVEVLTHDYPKNEFNTFWEKSDVELSKGLDINADGAVYARITHLQHVPFTYNIQVENRGPRRKGTVRIFLAPKFDERGKTMSVRSQRLQYIEMDKFVVDLEGGLNTIERSSFNSSVTIPYERSFRRLDPTTAGTNPDYFNYCGCGWPNHMLVPKGNAEGYPAQLFVMVSNYGDDKVDQPPPTGCTSGHSFCGYFNRKYPDRRPMGYPFDRNPRRGAETMELFMTPNMHLTDVTIKFTNRVEIRHPNITAKPVRTARSRPRRQVDLS